MKTIDLNDSIAKLVKENEDFINILVELGFKDITKPGMLATAGKFMNLKKGAKLKKINIELIKEVLKEKGYLVIGEDNE